MMNLSHLCSPNFIISVPANGLAHSRQTIGWNSCDYRDPSLRFNGHVGRVLTPLWINCYNTWNSMDLHFIQCIARNWPLYSLRGLHIRITWFSLYGTRIPLFSLYGIHMPLFPYMVIQPIVARTTIVTSQWYDRYCFTEYAWTPGQRECTAITDCQSIDSLLDSMRFVTHFWEIIPYILRDAIVG